MSFAGWRIVHRFASGFIALAGLVHSVLTAVIYSHWGPDALWFLGSGLSLVFLAAMNWAHVGLEPCRMPTAPVVRYASVVYAVFGVAAVAAVSQPHVWLLAGALVTQAVAGFFTLLGPEARVPSH